jgi:hypothetical protein
VASLVLRDGVAAVCTAPLLIDDFSRWSQRKNSLGSRTSGMCLLFEYTGDKILTAPLDDGSMPSISATSKSISFTPRYSSYLYENIPCQTAISNGYSSVQFTVTGPVGGNMTLEMQTRESCSASKFKSSWFLIEELTGGEQTVTVPLSSWPELNHDAITALVWSTWSSSSTSWEVSQIQFGCETTAAIPPSQATGRLILVSIFC